MRIFYSPDRAGKWAPGSIAAIGKFDGIHLGHQKLLRQIVARAQALKTTSLAVTFDPLPQQHFLGSEFKPLLSLKKRLALIAALGVDGAVVLPFNDRLACQAPESFARDILANALRVMDVYVGENFCFGKDRAGDTRTLKSLGREHGFLVHTVPLMKKKGQTIRSTAIYDLLRRGQKEKALEFLGRRKI